MSNVSSSLAVSQLLNAFSYMALVISFLGVSLGLLDYLADFFTLSDEAAGRTKNALVTFVPPTLTPLLLPDGFLYAIGFAGLAATIWAVMVPTLPTCQLSRTGRQRHDPVHHLIPADQCCRPYTFIARPAAGVQIKSTAWRIAHTPDPFLLFLALYYAGLLLKIGRAINVSQPLKYSLSRMTLYGKS